MVRGVVWIGLLLLVACGGEGGGTSDPVVLVVEREPLGGDAGEAMPLFVIRVESGNVSRITIEVESTGDLPAGRTPGLNGTLSVPVVNDRASFDDIVLTGAAADYVLRARAGSAGVLTAPFDINAGPAFRVAFLETPPDTPVGSPMDAFRVAVLDRWDNFVVRTNHDVTIEIDSLDPFGRDVLLHASGEEIFEFVDCEGPYVLAPEEAKPLEPFDAMTFDEGGTDRIWATSADNSLIFYDIFFGGGIRFVQGSGTLARRYTGLYFDATGQLWGLPLDGSAEFAINTTTGRDDSGSVPITLPGETIEGFNGAAVDAVTGDLYVAARLAGEALPRLLSVDFNNEARVRGTLQQGCADLATKFDGVSSFLFAVSPDPDPVLYEVDPLTASMTKVIDLGNGTDGEAISYVFPAPLDITGASFVQPSSNGIASFGGFRWTLMADDVSLVATSPGLQPDTSNRFSITRPDTGAQVSFMTSAQTVDENAGTITFQLTVSRAMPHDMIVVIDTGAWADDTDMPAHSRQIIRAGETSRTVAFDITDDGAAEGDEVLTARITGVSLGSVGPGATHALTIRDND
ncbi:MAG: hypothetical protein ACYTHK_11340 [Planctomycetota bacterium]|jgi:hypothetical protein